MLGALQKLHIDLSRIQTLIVRVLTDPLTIAQNKTWQCTGVWCDCNCVLYGRSARKSKQRHLMVGFWCDQKLE